MSFQVFSSLGSDQIYGILKMRVVQCKRLRRVHHLYHPGWGVTSPPEAIRSFKEEILGQLSKVLDLESHSNLGQFRQVAIPNNGSILEPAECFWLNFAEVISTSKRTDLIYSIPEWGFEYAIHILYLDPWLCLMHQFAMNFHWHPCFLRTDMPYILIFWDGKKTWFVLFLSSCS